MLVLLNWAVSSSQTIPVARLTDWSTAGYQGTTDPNTPVINVLTQGLVNDSITDNGNILSTLINSLNGQRAILYFPPGIYKFESTINLRDSIILRGASSDSTQFRFDFNGNSGNCISTSGGPNGNWFDVTGGAVKDNSWITAADSGVLQPGTWAEIRQENGAWDTQPISWADHSIGQLVYITGRSNDTLFFENALRITYDTTRNIQISSFTPATETGIECISYERADSASCFCPAINYYHAVNCWIKGVEGKKSISAHALLDASSNISITGSYFHHAYEYNGSSMHGYGIALFYHTGQCLIENNIFRMLRHSLSFQCGANGNVIAYNYSREPNRSEPPANYGADISMHGHYSYCNLFEGNIVQNIQLDQTWGPSGPHNTFFRNRAELYGILMSSGSVNSDFQNFVGNDVPSTVFLQGNYILAGSGHFEFGNNIRGTITPPGTASLPDTSYYLHSTPGFWNIPDSWPSIGTPNGPNAGTIPARHRYFNSNNLTVCASDINTGVPFTVAENKSMTFYPCPASYETVIFIPDAGKKELIQVQLFDISGRKVIDELHYDHPVRLQLSGISPGLYIVRATVKGRLMTGQLIVN